MNAEHVLSLMDENQANELEFAGQCADCKQPVSVVISLRDGNIEITGGAVYRQNDKYRVKCDTCFAAEPALNQQCEVYSRIVGYLRPTENWNKAKKAEFNNRKNFKI
jgi:hypothetical protein